MAANSENSSRPSLESFRLCVQSICPKFNVSSLKESQFQALYSFICGEEVFVNLPTGSGKSLIFQLAPLVHTWMHYRREIYVISMEFLAANRRRPSSRFALRDVNERRLYSQATTIQGGKRLPPFSRISAISFVVMTPFPGSSRVSIWRWL